MESGAFSIGLLAAIAVGAANLPFFTRRIFFVRGRAEGADKGFGWRLLEWTALYLVVVAIARWLEGVSGPAYPQNWEFYVITLALFGVLAYPGFVYRYLWRGGARDGAAQADTMETGADPEPER